MKGASRFSRSTADEIRGLLREKVRSDRDSQKRVRRHLRNLGFYISDFASGAGPFTAADFDGLVQTGAIVIAGE